MSASKYERKASLNRNEHFHPCVLSLRQDLT